MQPVRRAKVSVVVLKFPLAGGRSSAAGLWSATLTRPHMRSLPQYFHITCFGGDKGARWSLYVCSIPQGESFLIKALSLWARRVVYYSPGRTRRCVPHLHRWSVMLTFPWPCQTTLTRTRGWEALCVWMFFTVSCRSMGSVFGCNLFWFGYGFAFFFCASLFDLISGLKGEMCKIISSKLKWST